MSEGPDLIDVLSNLTHHVAAFLFGAILHKSVEIGNWEMVLVAFLCGKIIDILP